MTVKSNWNEVKQDIIDAMANFKNEFRDKALNDINNKINSKGIKSVINGNNVEYEAIDIIEYAHGKVYFDDVFKNINNQTWVDSI